MANESVIKSSETFTRATPIVFVALARSCQAHFEKLASGVHRGVPCGLLFFNPVYEMMGPEGDSPARQR